jgi:uncharacterized membrane protein YkvA (DUF1232 family)
VVSKAGYVLWDIVTGFLIASLAMWVVLVVGLMIARPRQIVMRDAFRLLPDVVRLLRRLGSDPTVARDIRIRVWCVLAYLAIPIDLIPDFVPVIGFADDVIITLVVLRSVAHRAGRVTIERHWPGTVDGLEVVYRLGGIRSCTR